MAPAPAKSVSILLVDDSDEDAELVERALARVKITNPLVRAINGLDALAILRGTNGKQKLEKPFIILTDLNMPRMNGIEFLQQIRADPALQQSVVFMLTTSAAEEDRVAAYNLNAAGYMIKADPGDDLLKLVSLLANYWRIVELPYDD